MMNDLFGPVADGDLHDLAGFSSAAEKLLAALDAHRDILAGLIDAMVDNPELVGLCEHYDILDKLVLHNDPTGWRLRLHVFAAGYFDRPHNHRWNYASRILRGSYTHTLYGTDELLGGDGTAVDPSSLVPLMVRTEQAGGTYTLHHSMIHSVVAEPDTTTLVVRGPALRSRFLVSDRVTGQVWWQHGAAGEAPEESARKRMTEAQVRTCVDRLTSRGVLP